MVRAAFSSHWCRCQERYILLQQNWHLKRATNAFVSSSVSSMIFCASIALFSLCLLLSEAWCEDSWSPGASPFVFRSLLEELCMIKFKELNNVLGEREFPKPGLKWTLFGANIVKLLKRLVYSYILFLLTCSSLTSIPLSAHSNRNLIPHISLKLY